MKSVREVLSMQPMKKVVLFPNQERDVGLVLTEKVRSLLAGLGVECPVCSGLGCLEGLLRGADMVVTFGGDGTILRAARCAAPAGVPLLGINMGNKGFMAELEAGDTELVRRAVEGNYAIECRMMLDAEVVRGGARTVSDFALNDVVVGGIARVIAITALGDGREITSFSGDGIVVATPTGSTAYSMAAGGPIVEPDAENIIVTPICPHVLRAKSYVLTSSRVVTVVIGKLGGKPAYFSADGGESVPLCGGDRIGIRRSALVTRLVRVTDRSFYEKVSEKLGEKR